MSRPGWQKALSLAGTAVGVVAAGGATALAVRHRKGVRAWQSAGEEAPLGSLRGDVRRVRATDGLRLYAKGGGGARVVSLDVWRLASAWRGS